MTRTPLFIHFPSLFACLVLSSCFAKEASVEEQSLPHPAAADQVAQESSEPEGVSAPAVEVAVLEEGRVGRSPSSFVDGLRAGETEIDFESLTIGGVDGETTAVPERAGLEGIGSGSRRTGVKAAGRAPKRPSLRHVVPPVVRHHSSSEEYTDHGVNPFTSVVDDAKSTFSIDVDTASYTLARRKLRGGVLPSWEGIRAEEFVNF